jgi:hypothetical protein
MISVRIFRISQAAVNISPFGLASTTCNLWDSRRTLASISGSKSCASLDRGPHLHLAAKSSHSPSTRRPITRQGLISMPILDAEWRTGGRELGWTTRPDFPFHCGRACEEPNEDV